MPPAEPGPPPVPLADPVRAALERRAEPDGFVPFDRFMAVALYDPHVGYYARARSPFGPAGDYYTAPRVHPMYARTLAARVRAVRDALGPAEPFRLVELGSGDGLLAEELVRSLGGGPAGLEYVAVESTEARRAASLARLAPAARSAGVTGRTAGSLSELGPVRGVVIAHELLDAQPARRLRWDGGAWRESGAVMRDGGLRADERPLLSPVPSPALPALTADDAGAVLEVSPAAEGLLREVGDHLTDGLAVIVDYGAEQSELLAGHPRGTLATVRSHRSVDQPWEAPGECDLSTFVNFTRVRAVAAGAGLVEVGYRSQAEALAAWGLERELQRSVAEARSAEEEVRVRLAAKSLVFGFGSFRVLELAPPASAAALRAVSADASRA